VTILDTGTGNLFSLVHAFRRAGADAEVTRDPVDVARSTCIVVPGVASFPAVVRGTARVRRDLLRAIESGVPLLGVCAGMQLLFDSSEEGPGEGLGLLRGRVRALQADVVPHMGWSPVTSAGDPWLSVLPPDAALYFAHSFAVPTDAPGVVATARHGKPFAAAVRSGPVFGVQFHPEKSGPRGTDVLRGFLSEAGVFPSG
jgi:glutamine amidotransferase